MLNARVALVHDWLTAHGGAERVLERLLDLFPSADLYCLIDSGKGLSEKYRSRHRITTSFLQHIPAVTTNYGLFAGLMPAAIERLDLRSYDLVISSSWAFAHGAIKNPQAKHIAYVHSPMRWAWDLESEYLERAGFPAPIDKLAKWQLKRLRHWDRRAAQRPDVLFANSHFIQDRITRCWQRSAEVVYPPVAIPKPRPRVARQDYYLTASRLVSFKRVDFWVKVFGTLPSHRLVIAGSGPELKRLQAIAPPNVEFAGRVSDQALFDLMAGARGFLQASTEDFGMAVIEAQGCGTPVIALGQGGVKEGVIDIEHPRPTGLFFGSLEVEVARRAILDFEKQKFQPEDCIANAQRFSPETFDERFMHHLTCMGLDLQTLILHDRRF